MQRCNSSNTTLLSGTNQTGCSSAMEMPTCDDPTSTSDLLLVIFLTFITIATLFGNSLVIAVVVAYRRLQQVANFFIVSLAVADLLSVFLQFPFGIYQTIHNGIWCSSLGVCTFWLIVDGILSGASMCGLAGISMDRLIAITMPFKYNEIMTKRTSFIMIIAVWAYAIFWGLMALVNFTNLGAPHIGYETPYGSRISCHKVDAVYYTCAAVFAFFVPLVIIIIAYSVIFKAAITQAKAVAALDPNRNQRKRTTFFREVKATKVVALVIGAFVICWLPLFIIFQALFWDPENTRAFFQENPKAQLAISYIFLRILPPLNSCLNPLIYALFNSNFRAAFRKFLHLPRRSPTQMDHTMVTTATTDPERPSYTTVRTERTESQIEG